MKIKLLVLASFLVTGCSSMMKPLSESITTQDGVVKIFWQQPEKYTDIQASNELQSRYQQKLFNVLTHNLNHIAERVLKHDQQLEMQVTNLDLAGDVQPSFGPTSDLRVIKAMYPPKISFSYKVMQGEHLLMQGQETLVDMNFLGGIHPLQEDPFVYEEIMLTHWFNKTIAPRLEGVPPK